MVVYVFMPSDALERPLILIPVELEAYNASSIHPGPTPSQIDLSQPLKMRPQTLLLALASATTWVLTQAAASDANADTLDNIDHACAANFPVVNGEGGAQPSIICVIKNQDLLFVKLNHTFYPSTANRICCPAESVCMQEEFESWKNNYKGNNSVCYSPS